MEAELERLLRESAAPELLSKRLREFEHSHERRPEVTSSDGLQALFERLQQVRTCELVWGYLVR